MSELAQDRGQGLRFGQREADAAVTRQIPGTGQHQIAQARETHQRFALAAERRGQPPRFREPARDNRGARVVAEAEAVAGTGGDREDVLYRASDLDAREVIADVGAKSLAAQAPRHVFGNERIGRRHRDRGRQAARHFLGKAGARDDADGGRPEGREDAMRKCHAGRVMRGDETLAQPEKRDIGCAACRRDDVDQSADRRRDEEQRCAGENLLQICADGNRQIQCDARKIACVFARHGQHASLVGIARPQPNRRCRGGLGEMHRQRRSPRACAEDRNSIHRRLQSRDNRAQGQRPQTCWMRTNPACPSRCRTLAQPGVVVT